MIKTIDGAAFSRMMLSAAAEIDLNKQKVNELTKQERRALLETVKQFSVDIASCAPVEQAIVTSGGVKVSEVNAKTMESKLVQGLYFAGELLDVDAYTGGFNLLVGQLSVLHSLQTLSLIHI